MTADAKVEEAIPATEEATVPLPAKEEALEEVAVVVQEVKVEIKEAPGGA